MRTKTKLGVRLFSAFVCLSFGFPAISAKKNKPPDAFAIIAGTVFRPPGFAAGGAEVLITPLPASEQKAKPKSIKLLTDARGEFSVRVSAVPMQYRVDVKMDGYQAQQKTVFIEGEVRQDLNFVLETESKPGRDVR